MAGRTSSHSQLMVSMMTQQPSWWFRPRRRGVPPRAPLLLSPRLTGIGEEPSGLDLLRHTRRLGPP
jgi:hypothetical protein